MKEHHPVQIDPSQAAIEHAEAQQSDAALLHRARISRRARSRFVRRLADSLHGQLREIITQDTDKLLAVIQAGGALRVGLEVALPDQVLAAMQAAQAQPTGEQLVTADLNDSQVPEVPHRTTSNGSLIEIVK